MIELPFSLVIAAVLAVLKMAYDGWQYWTERKIRHGLEFAVVALLIGVLTYLTNNPDPTRWVLWVSTYLALGGIFGITFRAFHVVLGQGWEYLGDTAVTDRVLKRLFGENGGRVGLTIEFAAVMFGLIARLALGL